MRFSRSSAEAWPASIMISMAIATCSSPEGDPSTRSGVSSEVCRPHCCGEEPTGRFHDVTQAAGAAVGDLFTHGATAADFDHDGFVDLLVYGYAGVRLLRNQGDGTFQDVTTAAGLANAPWTTAAAWCDLNEDGVLDLYFGSYVAWNFDTHRVCRMRNNTPDVCAPQFFEGGVDAFYWGAADGTFVEDSHPGGAIQRQGTGCAGGQV